MDAHGNIEMSSASGNNLEIFGRSLALVGVAELFDKTWFMGLIFALRWSPQTVFLGSFVALFMHCFLAAALGLAFARFLSKVVLSWMTAGLFFTFMCMYAKDWYQADPESDAIEAGKEEVSGELEEEENEKAEKEMGNVANLENGRQVEPSEEDPNETEACLKPSTIGTPTKEGMDLAQESSKVTCGKSANGGPSDWTVFAKSFMGVFIAEWGDRTQIAMIGQHSSQPLVPVFLGSAVAFFLLTLSAVGAASLLNGQKLREKTVFGFSACCFGVFGLLALKDAIFATAGNDAD